MQLTALPKSVRSHPHTGSFGRVRSTRIFWENGVSRSWRRGDGRPDVSGIGGWRPGEGPADTLRLPGLQGCGTRRRRSWARRPFLLPTQLLLLLLKDHLAQPLPLDGKNKSLGPPRGAQPSTFSHATTTTFQVRFKV